MPASSSSSSDLLSAEKLWTSADLLRGQVDAAEYKHVVLGLLFLKYISDAFAATPGRLKAELEYPQPSRSHSNERAGPVRESDHPLQPA